jgi:hypothetical protein
MWKGKNARSNRVYQGSFTQGDLITLTFAVRLLNEQLAVPTILTGLILLASVALDQCRIGSEIS